MTQGSPTVAERLAALRAGYADGLREIARMSPAERVALEGLRRDWAPGEREVICGWVRQPGDAAALNAAAAFDASGASGAGAPRVGGTAAPRANASVGAFVTPSTVRQAKDALDPFVRSLDDAVYACEAISVPRRAAWSRWFIQWDKFHAAEEGFLTAGAEMDQVEQLERAYQAWEAEIGRACPLYGPTYASRGDAPAPSLAAPLMWLGIGVGVLGLAWLASSVATTAGGLGAVLGRAR